jgi:hypothetical protein
MAAYGASHPLTRVPTKVPVGRSAVAPGMALLPRLEAPVPAACMVYRFNIDGDGQGDLMMVREI